MTIYELLERDHEELKDLLRELVALSSDEITERDRIVNEIKKDLIPHSRAEETVFYNSIRTLDKGGDMIFHAFKEHAKAETLIRRIQTKDKESVDWKETAMELQQALVYHIDDEQGAIFKHAQSIFSDQEAHQLGTAFMKVKEKIKTEGAFKSSIDFLVNLMPPRLVGNINQKPDLRNHNHR